MDKKDLVATSLKISNVSTLNKISSISTENAIDKNSGSINTLGGISAHKNLYVGQDAIVVNDITVGGNFAVSGTLQITDVVTIQDATNSKGPDSGSLVVQGGLGVNLDAFFGSMFKAEKICLSIEKTTLTLDKTLSIVSEDSYLPNGILGQLKIIYPMRKIHITGSNLDLEISKATMLCYIDLNWIVLF